MARVVTVTANPLLDLVSSGRFARGQVSRVGRFEPVAGGKGLNVGRVLARHGHRVTAVFFAGGETGARLCDKVRADGMETRPVPTAARTRIGFQLLEPAAATAALEGGFAVSSEEASALVEAAAQQLAGAELVVLAGSAPDRTCETVYARIAERCARAGVPVWLDSWGPIAEAVLRGHAHPALAKPNRQELGDGALWQSCPELHVTDGPNLVEVRVPGRRFRVRPPEVVQVNPIGSGDSYLAGLAHARLSGFSLEDQLRYAAAAGAANACRPDVACVGPEEIEALAPAVRVERAG